MPAKIICYFICNSIWNRTGSNSKIKRRFFGIIEGGMSFIFPNIVQLNLFGPITFSSTYGCAPGNTCNLQYSWKDNRLTALVNWLPCLHFS
jgi:hypothetical protein